MQINYRNCVGQLRERHMVVGDDRIDAQLFCAGDLLLRGDSVVNRDNQLHALFGEQIHGGFVHAVALGLARRNIVGDIRSDRFKIRIQKRG